MATRIVPVPQAAVSAPGFLLHPLHSLSVRFSAWRERRRQRAGAALLMRLEPNMLKDIGVILAEQRGGASAMLKWHPAVLVATFEPDPDPPDAQLRY